MLPYLRNLLAVPVGFMLTAGLCIILTEALWLILDAPLPFMPVLLDELLFWQPDRVDYNHRAGYNPPRFGDVAFTRPPTGREWLLESAGTFVLWGFPIGIAAGCAGGFVWKEMVCAHRSLSLTVLSFLIPFGIGALACFLIYSVVPALPVAVMLMMWIGVRSTNMAYEKHFNRTEVPCSEDSQGTVCDSVPPGDRSD